MYFSRLSLRVYLVFFASFSVLLCTGVRAAESGFEKVPGFKPVQAGEHPRLLFRKHDLPEIRRRANTPEGKKIVARLKATLNGATAVPPPELRHPAKNGYLQTVSLPEGGYSISHAAGFGMLYQLTGDTRYADLARECMDLGFAGVRDRDPQARYSMVFGHGQLRVGPSLAWTALAYDLCYDAWSPEYRQKVASYLLNYDSTVHVLEGLSKAEEKTLKSKHYDTKDMALKPKHGPNSNHFGSITGGVGMALLAVMGDPEANQPNLANWLETNEKHAVRALNGFGKRGFFFEGQGASHMGAYPAMLSYFQALRNVKGRDYIRNNERMQWITLRWVGEVTTNAKDQPVYLVRHEAMGQQYGSDLLVSSGGLSDNGRFSLGFGSLPESVHPYVLWTFNEYFASADQGRFDTLNYPHLAISALVNWPIGVQPKNPEGLLPKAYRDEEFGHYVFRSGWTGNTDEVVMTAFTALKGSTRQKPWDGRLPFKIRAYGKKHEFGIGVSENKTEEVDYHHDTANNTTSVTFSNGRMIGTDFSGRSNASGVFVQYTGKGWKKKKGQYAAINAGYFSEFMTQTVNGFTVLTVRPDHTHPEVVADGDGVKVGGLRIALEGKRVVFSDAAAPTGMIDSFAVRGIDPRIDAVTPETLKHPGKPDALLSFDYQDYEQQGDDGYFKEAFGRGASSWVYNIRPEHLRPGVFGQALPLRPSGVVESVLPTTDSLAEGEVTHPLGFDGIKTAVLLPDEPHWNFGPGSQTVTFWLKFNEPRSGYALILEPKGFRDFHMGFHPGPTIMMGGRFGGVNAPFPNSAGDWRHVALVFDAERKLMTYYVDGELAGRAASKGSKEAAKGPTIISGRQAGGARFPGISSEGDLDEWAMYKRALTAGEIMALYEAGMEGTPSLTGRPADRETLAAFIDADQTVGPSPLPVRFSTKRSIVPGDGATFEWDFGDGTTGTGPDPQHTYAKDGSYTVRLTLRSGSAQHTATVPVQVFNRSPVARIRRTSGQGGLATLSAAESYDPDGGPLTITWSVNGTKTSGETVTINSLPPGSHEVICTATDQHGGTGSDRYSLNVPDAQGFRLPENPRDVVPGLHYHRRILYRTVEPYPASHPEVQKVTEFQNVGTVNELSFSSITAASSGRHITFAGYVSVPRDGTYTIKLDGLKRTRFGIGNELLIENASSFDRLRPATTETIKLRRGLHRVVFYHPGHILSKNSPFSFFFARVVFEHQDGSHFVLGNGNVFRSRLQDDEMAMDVVSLKGPLPERIPLASGNRAPQVSIQQRTLGEMPGARTVELKANATDPDGDPVNLTWYMPDGNQYRNVQTMTRSWTAGTYTVSLFADDGRGGRTRETVTLEIEGLPGRSISFDLMNMKPGEFGIFPGEQVGLAPSANWNTVLKPSKRKQKGGTSDGSQFPRFGSAVKVHSDEKLWMDSTGQAIPGLKVRLPKGIDIGVDRGMPYALNRSPTTRLWRSGGKTEELVVEGIPYATYDVIVYLMGDTGKEPGTSPWWSDRADTASSSRKKRRSTGSSGDPIISVNGTKVEIAPGLNRWNGIYSELTADNPNGNVLFFRGIRGSTCTLKLSGGVVAGFQIIER